jgi:hypothetical protein
MSPLELLMYILPPPFPEPPQVGSTDGALPDILADTINSSAATADDD